MSSSSETANHRRNLRRRFREQTAHNWIKMFFNIYYFWWLNGKNFHVGIFAPWGPARGWRQPPGYDDGNIRAVRSRPWVTPRRPGPRYYSSLRFIRFPRGGLAPARGWKQPRGYDERPTGCRKIIVTRGGAVKINSYRKNFFLSYSLFYFRFVVFEFLISLITYINFIISH